VGEGERARAQRQNALNANARAWGCGALLVIGLVGSLVTGGDRAPASSSSPRAADASSAPAPPPPTYDPEGIPAPSSGYKTLFANVWVDQPLYLRTDKTFIGTVAAVEDDHRFADGTVRDAVLVRFTDGSRDWIPRRTLQQIYVTR
jgi:hypothetical protein